ncbi:MAG: hypothetical protein ACREUO_12075 [Burkholderiales bacterium]
MELRPAKFKLQDEVALAGKLMRVAGLVQLEGADAKVTTRYLLVEGTAAPQILEESGETFTLLRPFPPGAPPVAAGNTVTVMGAKYTLSGVRKMKVLGSEGQVPGGALGGPLLLSGVFASPAGTLVREMTPGTPGQTFFSVKPIGADEVLSAAQVAAQQEAEKAAAGEQAQAEAETEQSGSAGLLQKAAFWIILILVIGGIAYACSGPDEDSSSGSARSSTSFGGGHGGK